ncbi:nucleotidyltransferase family protein [Skermanella sp. TT6]|uniref:Nucleotidyltransferase family protein n=1 Tax=Skermanella cutis TaxID=2775420 RepID=A0ABX7B2S3_9PROT|nr:nucleotidyltransferase family protein [Skermanella sp. TT6]QQP87959.1 nucleotidyltransferase family protein [Skermanella sp. TT6]
MTTLTHAMVLAAGLGLRMRPLTLEQPKPLIPVAGKPLLDHALDRVAAAGIGTAVVNTHYKGEMIADHLAGRTSPRILLSPEADLLETGGGIRQALPLLGTDPFLSVNSDILWLDGPTPAIDRLTRAWNPETMDALLLLHPAVAAFGYDGKGDFHMDPLGRLTRRRSGEIAPFVFAGVQILKPELFADVPPGAFSTNLIWDRLLESERLYGMRHDGLWFHVGTPASIGEVDDHLEFRPHHG